MSMRTVTLSLSEVIAASGEELRELALTRLLDEHAVDCQLPTTLGDFQAVGYGTAADGEVTVALIHGRPDAESPVRTHVHCLLGDTFGSGLCSCRADLEAAIKDVLAARAGVLIYVKPAGGEPFACPADREVDPALVSALLRHVNVLTRRPAPSPSAHQLSAGSGG
jgi:hypothetical protein